MKNYYFDNNATSAVAPEVTEVMLPFFTKYWGNPSSIHEFGGQVGKYVRNARAQVADLINADPSDIYLPRRKSVWQKLQLTARAI
jgi:cysteine desulfurase